MNLRNLLKPGDYFIPVPVGLPLKLEYSDKGVLKSIFLNIKFDNAPEGSGSTKKLSVEVKDQFIKYKLVPSKISVVGGTTYVFGVLVAPVDPKVNGKLPESMFTSVSSALEGKKAADLKFYSYHAISYATRFIGAYATLRWLDMSGFRTLQGQLMSISLPSDETFLHQLWARVLGDITNVPLPALIAVYRVDKFFLYHCGYTQVCIKTVQQDTDNAGYFWSKVTDLSGKSYVLDYSTGLEHAVSRKGSFIVDSDSTTVAYRYPLKDKTVLPKICPVCGAPLDTSVYGRTKCSDKNCKSYLYVRIIRLLQELGLPQISADRFKHEVAAGHLTCVSDIFLLPELAELKVHTSLVHLIQGLCPHLRQNEKNALHTFINRCSNSISSVEYYLQHPEVARCRIDVYVPGLDAVLDWFAIPENWTALESLILNDQNIIIDSSLKSFEGDPIFRGTTIAITGSFIHGTLDDVESILNSYSATVVRQFTDAVSIVLVGSQFSDIDGNMIQQARQAGRAVVNEVEFFKQYNIDDDLRANLL